MRSSRSETHEATVYLPTIHQVAWAEQSLRKEPEKMFEWLEHAWTTHDSGVNELLADPFLRAYKDDPRFIAFAQKIGVMPKVAPKR